MNQHNPLQSIEKLYLKLRQFPQELLTDLSFRVEQNNPWFNAPNFYLAWEGILNLISPQSIENYELRYGNSANSDKKIGLILAGNIPAVGFHDVLMVLLSGAEARTKLSSEDKIFIPFLIQQLAEIDAQLARKCVFVDKLLLSEINGVVATGSDNTARYFEQYFTSIPHIIRKSRTSVAVLRGTESPENLALLVEDIVQYFGLGCRNVSKILLLGNTQIIPLLQVLEQRAGLTNFSKYDNNYLYYKSIYLVNREPFLDTENMLFKESDLLSSPISVLYYQSFETEQDISNYIDANEHKIQCVLGSEEKIGFGQSQNPGILDFPDGVDLGQFIIDL